MTVLIPRSRLVALLALSVVPALAGAQGRATPPDHVATTDPSVTIPRSMVPPAGKCRIWMRDVPAAQQPAPTDCTTALRQAPANGVLVFGPARRDLSPFEARKAASEIAREREREREQERARSNDRARRDSASRDPGRGAPTRSGATVTPTRREAEVRQPAATPREQPPARPSTPPATPAQGAERPTGGSKPPATKKPE